jgi:hypothetical protein
VVARPDGTVFINTTGNPGMAAGGMGDVLTGLIAGLITQGMEAGAAACAGVYLHGSGSRPAGPPNRPEGLSGHGSHEHHSPGGEWISQRKRPPFLARTRPAVLPDGP